MKRNYAVAAAVTTALAWGWSDISGAQTTSPSDEAQLGRGELEEVIITARRHEERLQDVPASVTALSGEGLIQQGILELQDITRATPGLIISPSFAGSAAPAFTIRSQRNYLVNPTADPAVLTYFNDVVLARPQGLNSALFDLDSVQVLKGPQGTLFGRNTTGGAILLTSKAPTDEFEGYVDLTAGDYDLRTVEAVVNVPLSSSFAVRAAGRLVDREGYTRNLADGRLLDGEHTQNWRLSARFEPNDDFSNTLMVSGMSQLENGTGYRVFYVRPTGLIGAAAQPILSDLQNRDFHTVNMNMSPTGHNVDVETLTVTDKTHWTLNPSMAVEAILGYRNTKSRTFYDLDGTPINALTSEDVNDIDQYSAELHASGTIVDGSLDYIFGAYYFEESGLASIESRVNGTPRRSIGDIENTSRSVFAQSTYRTPWISGLSLTGGVRFTQDRRDLTAHSTANGACRLRDPNGLPVPNCSLPLSTDFDEPTWTVSADYKLTPDMLVYLTSRRGYRSGGFTLTATQFLEFGPYRPETVQDYELGLKTSWTLGSTSGTFNVAAYYLDYEDIQQTVTQVIQVGGTTFVTSPVTNAASAYIEGVETDFTWRPMDNISINGFYAYSKPKFEKFLNNGVDLTSDAFIGAPEHTAGMGVEWSLALASDLGELALRADGYYQSVSYYQVGNSNPVTRQRFSYASIPSYSVVNARADWRRVFGSPVDVSLYAKNLLDKEYRVGGVDIVSSFGTAVAVLAPPRTYGVQLRYSF